jgi:hypothetical protein
MIDESRAVRLYLFPFAFLLLPSLRQAAVVAAELAPVVVKRRVEAFGQLDLDL